MLKKIVLPGVIAVCTALVFLLNGCTGCGEYLPEGEKMVDKQPPTLLRPIRTIGGHGDSPGRFIEPRDIHIDAKDQLYVADFRNYRIQVFDEQLEFVRQWGGKGQQDGLFNDPCGLAVAPNGDVVVCDTWNHRVQVFTNEGRHRFTLGGMVAPRGAVVHSDGTIFVSDSGNCIIKVYDPNGRPLRQWGECGFRRGQFVEPVGLLITPDESLWVADNDNARLQVFDLTGRFRREIPVAGWTKKGAREPYLDMLPDGTLVMSVPEMHKVVRLDRQGKLLDNFGGHGSEPGRFITPTGVAVDSRGLVYVTDTWNHRIQVFELQSR
jgi:DNA-binding beta-propeller fold protein YncE